MANSLDAVFGGQAVKADSAPVPGLVKDTTTANFQKDVVKEGNGRVKLVKLNIDDHPSIPGQLGIQSIPAVIAFVGGRPVDGFMGAVPESQVRAFIDKVAGPAVDDREVEIEAALTDAKAALDAGDVNTAGGIYDAVLQADPENLKALAGMAECLIAAGQWEGARDMLAQLSPELAKDAAIVALQAKLGQIEGARSGITATPPSAIRARCSRSSMSILTITKRGSSSPRSSMSRATARRRPIT